MYVRLFKPAIDFVVALAILIVTLPVFIVITVLLSFLNDGNPFFKQDRPGKKGKIFRIIKFRTMNGKRDEKGELLPDLERLTKIGLFVRKSSLDELPQLINVLSGDMSLVGPRPLLVEYLQRYSSFQIRRHEVKPGITGWAQVNGRNSISWNDKFELDVWYVDHLSFKLDLKILFLTLVKVIKRDGINKEGHATTVGFNGNN